VDPSGPFDARAHDPLATVELELPRGRSSGAVARLIAAGVGTRAGLRVDRLEDLKLAVEATLRQPFARDTLSVAMTPTQDDLEIEVGPLAAARLDSRGLEGVLSPLVDEIRARRTGDDVWIAMRMRRPQVAADRWRP
jgi:hypothetical protein